MDMLHYYTMVLFLGIVVSLTKRGVLSGLLHLQGLLLRYGRLEQEAAFTHFKLRLMLSRCGSSPDGGGAWRGDIWTGKVLGWV